MRVYNFDDSREDQHFKQASLEVWNTGTDANKMGKYPTSQTFRPLMK